ncbi:LmrA/YxaF family transcription factor [Streptomyces avidinii]|uniref:LmrA/YxaF family transcription factor n=1 Tax=Streptomyces avidinii TaxID=1895 RepID=UPI0035564286
MAGGLPEPAARDTASAVIALLEGAFMLGRASRSTDPANRATPGGRRRPVDPRSPQLVEAGAHLPSEKLCTPHQPEESW